MQLFLCHFANEPTLRASHCLRLAKVILKTKLHAIKLKRKTLNNTARVCENVARNWTKIQAVIYIPRTDLGLDFVVVLLHL